MNNINQSIDNQSIEHIQNSQDSIEILDQNNLIDKNSVAQEGNIYNQQPKIQNIQYEEIQNNVENDHDTSQIQQQEHLSQIYPQEKEDSPQVQNNQINLEVYEPMYINIDASHSRMNRQQRLRIGAYQNYRSFLKCVIAICIFFVIFTFIFANGYQLMELLTLIIFPQLREEIEQYNENWKKSFIYTMIIIYFFYCILSLIKLWLFGYVYNAVIVSDTDMILRFLKGYSVITLVQEVINFFYYYTVDSLPVFFFQLIMSLLVLLLFLLQFKKTIQEIQFLRFLNITIPEF